MADKMLPRGSMRPLKQILGIVLLAAGLGLMFMPQQTADLLCSQKILFGILVAIAGYFHLISGRRL